MRIKIFLMQQANKQVWIDNLRAIATIGVIILHSAGDTVLAYGHISGSDWWAGDFYSSMGRFSVPVFIMLTGVLLLGKEYELGVFFKKRVVRVILPFLFWSLVYISFDLWTKAKQGHSILNLETVEWISNQLQHGSSFHFWYIYMLIGLYLFIPILGKWIRHSTEKEILYFLGIWFCSIILDLPAFSFIHLEFDIVNFSGHMGYLVLGYYLATKINNQKANNIIAGICVISGLAITISGAYFITVKENKIDEIFYENLSPNIVLFSIGVFLLFKRITISHPTVIKIRDGISKYSFGIYLSHVLILRYLMDSTIRWNCLHPVLFIPIVSLICLALSTALIYGLNKLPYGKYFAG